MDISKMTLKEKSNLLKRIGVETNIYKALVKEKDLIYETVKDNYIIGLIGCPKEYKKDKDFMLKLIHVNSMSFNYVDETLLEDKSFLLKAVKENGNILYSLSKTFKNDEEIVKAAIKNTPQSLQFASDRIKNKKEIVLLALNLSNDRSLLKFASKKIQKELKDYKIKKGENKKQIRAEHVL